jgi:hypothetical protein
VPIRADLRWNPANAASGTRKAALTADYADYADRAKPQEASGNESRERLEWPKATKEVERNQTTSRCGVLPMLFNRGWNGGFNSDAIRVPN